MTGRRDRARASDVARDIATTVRPLSRVRNSSYPAEQPGHGHEVRSVCKNARDAQSGLWPRTDLRGHMSLTNNKHDAILQQTKFMQGIPEFACLLTSRKGRRPHRVLLQRMHWGDSMHESDPVSVRSSGAIHPVNREV